MSSREHSTKREIVDPVAFWERRYRTHRDDAGKMWSGHVNASVERQVATFSPGTALELASGEGADAIWLASRGWTVTAVDISTAALEVAASEANRQGLSDRIIWERADLTTWRPASQYDLVISAFLHSPFDFPREEILRQAATAVAPGGRLLVVGHAAPPPGSRHEYGLDAPPLPTPEEVVTALALDEQWLVETSAFVNRTAIRSDSQEVTMIDSVVQVRRRGY